MSEYANLEKRMAAREVIGVGCSVEIDHFRPLRDALPSHLP